MRPGCCCDCSTFACKFAVTTLPAPSHTGYAGGIHHRRNTFRGREMNNQITTGHTRARVLKSTGQLYLLLLLALAAVGAHHPATAQTINEGFTIDLKSTQLLKTYVNTVVDTKTANAGDFVTGNPNGPHLATVSLQLIFLGPEWSTQTNPSEQDVVNSVNTILNSSYLSEMGQYGYQGPIKVANVENWDSDPPNPFQFRDIVNNMTALVQYNQVVPPSTPGVVYALFPAKEYIPGGDLAGTAGSHGMVTFSSGSAPVMWSSSANQLSILMWSFTHELVETISDPQIPFALNWQMDRTISGGNEIGDAIVGAGPQHLDGPRIVLPPGYQLAWSSTAAAPYWSQIHHAGVLPLGPAAALTNNGLGSYFDGSFAHVIYLDSNQHVNELYWDTSVSSWRSTDITQQAGAPTALACTALSCFYNSDTQTANVCYFPTDLNNEIHVLSRKAGGYWTDSSPSPFFITGIWSDAEGSRALAGYYDNVAKIQHAFFVEARNRTLVDVQFANGSWTQRGITGSSALAQSTQISGLFDGTPRVFYIGADQNVHESYFDGTTWQDNNWTVLSGDTVLPLPNAITSYVDSAKVDHVFYIGVDGDIHHLFRFGSLYGHENVTVKTGDVTPGSPALTSYFDGKNGHVYYLGPERSHQNYFGDMHEIVQTQWTAYFIKSLFGLHYFYSDTWAADDPSALTGLFSMVDSTTLTSCWDSHNGVGLIFGIQTDLPTNNPAEPIMGDVAEFYKRPFGNWGSTSPTGMARFYGSTPYALP